MATNVVNITGDSCSLRLEATNITGADPLEFLSGTFRSSAEEKRICTVFFITGGGTQIFQLRFEFISPKFVEHSILGTPVYRTEDSL